MKCFSALNSIAALLTLVSMACVTANVQADDKELTEVKLEDISLNVPKEWKQQQPSSRMRLAQFAVPGEEGDKEITEIVVFAPMAGSESEQVKRWIGQVHPQDRIANITKGKSAQGDYVFSDITGTHNLTTGGPFAGGKVREVKDFRIVNVMLKTDNGNYFLKITGPKETVAKHIEGFRHSFGGDAEKETKFGE